MIDATTEQIINDERRAFGPRFVQSRRDAEEAARRFINEHLGFMSTEHIIELGRLFNQHEKAGRSRFDRFTPGFTGAIMAKLGRNPRRFNQTLIPLWRGSIDDALKVLGQMFRDRSILPGAGSSLPSFLLYLRDPERFGICINATMDGLATETDASYRADSLDSYEAFCADLRAWREKHGVTPQEADAVLTEMMRRARPDNLLSLLDTTSEASTGTLVSGSTEAKMTAEQVATACYLPVEQIDEWVSALTTGMRQAVFHGPPGTGKTYVGRLLARHLATSPQHIESVQFHPAYSYEDFVEGLRPEVGAEGVLSYRVRPGVFSQLCERAQQAPDETFVLVIDEMNRADLAAVFGELMFLLEYRGDSQVTLPYSQRRMSVPQNLFMLGTMNTADRSLALLDFALRRRFHAFPVLPSEDVLSRWADARPTVDRELALGLFRMIRDRVGLDVPVSPGHSYWMAEGLDAATAERIWSYQLRPYLAEHWFERPRELEQLDADIRALIAERT
ncbi:AAA family ATPase [Micromonospora sp. NPDC002717]|uniref:McrB family protein n=1 Tax=Micromonospora sp. NPDC002717 TaxID=3154424 RepID=UPI00332DB4B5